ncbi:hypothetical protein PFICI_11471 [Pestalotiopsis fici W106-1]|uniref:AB hydrolase-1 domain-containing protein n=1 Tax=Pestalotiopsis fici (strain W106-1 / CGMCC3.15140) TaxID=1229662 RepID=W3WQK3_PESFW|nr:uncharacterized protein PFICI_11471 [Pestalotiopsis fici W106-1]ETS76084.1 hypothetical protein PFICI_11471 [Pestalotiopsis fici W106-1]
MADIPSSEGHIPFDIPGKSDTPGSTYYKVFGDLTSGETPLVMLHGGPGGAHEYLLPFAKLWPQYGIPVIFYDQVGCGRSTHLRDMAGNKEFWQESLFVAELNNLVDHFKLHDGPGFHLLGQSWGGILAVAFAATRPRGLQRLVLASALASIELSIKSIHLCKEALPADVQKVIDEGRAKGETDTPAYKEASGVFTKTFVSRAPTMAPELMAAFKTMSEDTTVYDTMYGPSLFDCIGTLVGWTGISRLPQITADTLVYNGEFDTSHDIAQEPFFELIPRVRWITFPNGSHFCHLDEGGLRERVLKVVGRFLTHHRVDKKATA